MCALVQTRLTPERITLCGFEAGAWFHRFKVARGTDHACLQVYFNSRGEFRPAVMGPMSGGSVGLFMDAAHALGTFDLPPNQTQPKAMPATPIFPEAQPFLKELYELLRARLPETIGMGVDHKPYMERYVFIRDVETACMDFYFNGKGRFTRRNPQPTLGNSARLLDEIQAAL